MTIIPDPPAETVAPERPFKTVGPEGRAVFSDILALFSGGKIAEALALGLSLPESVRGDPLVAIEIAKIARAGLNTSVMLEYGEIAFNAAPSNAPIGNTYSEILVDAGRPTDAVHVLVEALRQSHDPISAWHLLRAAKAARQAGSSTELTTLLASAIEQLNSLIKRGDKPSVTGLDEVLIQLNGLIGILDRSKALLAQAIVAGTEECEVEPFLAALSECGTLSEEEVAELLMLVPSVAGPLHSFAAALQAQGMAEEALQILRPLIESPVATEAIFLDAAVAEKRAGSGAELAVLAAAGSRFPESLALARARCQVAMELGDLAIAASAAEQIYRAQPGDPQAILNYVRLLTWQQRCSEALKVAEDALGANRDDPDLFEAAAHAARGAGQDELALNYAREAATLDPATAARRGFYAELMIKQGRLEDIGDTLAKFLADTPNSELAERAVMLLLELVRSRSPEYVDERHIQQLEILFDAKQDQLPIELLWDVARVADQLNLEHLAAKVFAAAIQRTKLDLGTVPPTAKLFIDQIAKRSLGNFTERDGRAAAAQQLLEAGLCAQATNESWRSEAAFRLAAYLAPGNPAAQINAGFVHLARGSVDAAWEQFASITRIYDNDMAFVAWPRAKTERGWPSMPFPCATGFEALKPADAEWPVITVITPSYNQAKYVEETILSVLNQEYPRLQYIVVDGLSKDGSVEIIRRYESRLDVVIIEKDKGQTEAINKGLAHAKGDIVTWVNSDDMLAPGALHIAALTWLRTRADLLYGVCLVHSDHRFILANLPAAEQESFTLLHLGEIFKYWMKGHFFYQPEVFFSRRILDLAGGTLDDTLYYTMDYKFWLQCAQNCARIEKIHWPFAIFRQHCEQKTANLLDCMLEQAEVRDQFVRIEPDAARRMEVRTRLHRAFDRSQVRVGVVSSRLGKIFSEDAADDLARELEGDGFKVELVASASALAKESDLVIKLVHLQADVDEIRALRGSGYRGAVVGWFWDNHHHLFTNFEVAEELDVVLPGHAFAGAYLKNRKAVLGPSVPLCVTQWSYSEARALFSSLANRPRSDRLYGGFVRYAFAKKRNGLIEGLIGEGCAGISFLEETNLKKYFGLSAADRFTDWMSHKVSVCLPLAGDLSQRMFDALLAGQIPIVAADIHDLDAVIPPEFQASLPVIRFERYDTGEVISAHGRALDRFEADGMEGVRRRHVYALKNHTFPSRIRSVIRHAEVLSQQL